ncbi:MAG: DUF4190 domain-containing protein [Polyangiaceae bacterium]|nr:DUF4190 domain-containing protein [Polyangiaceae bacterium]MCW5791097.1 DUF4190 domain-containing protein [Polyangiaceae bacterium]
MSDPGAPRPDPWLAEAEAKPTRHGLAVAALLTSTLGALCLPGVSGIVAVFLGIGARYAIERSEGKKTGTLMAWAAIVLGVIQLVSAGLVLWLVVRPKPPEEPEPLVASPAVSAPPASGAPGAAPAPSGRPGLASRPPDPATDRSLDDGILEARIGQLTLVDLGADAVPLESELERQRRLAQEAGERLVLWTVVPRCQPCLGVAAALPDPKLQRALGPTRLVRVNVHEHLIELERLKIPTDKIPGFALLGPRSRAIDYVNGGEWDEDVVDNIAPILEKFVRGELKQRRERWRGGRRDDETPI